MANPIILLSAALQVMKDHGTSYITVDNGGTGFTYNAADVIINAFNTAPGQIGGGEKAINYKTIGGQSIADFISRLKTELKAHNHTNLDVLNQITEEMLQKWNDKQDAIGFAPLDSAKKGQPDGYAPLNSDGKITNAFLPDNYASNRPFAVVDTIDERDALPDVKEAMLVLVNEVETTNPLDPSGPKIKQPILYYCKSTVPTVVWIPYVTINNTNATLTWDILAGKPTSNVADIDDAVTKAHTHANATVLDLLSANSDGKLMYNSDVISVGMNGARRMSVFNQKVESLSETFIIDTRFDPTKDTLWKVQYNGIKLIEVEDFTFDRDSKTITFLNNFKPSINKNLTITKFSIIS